MSDEAMAGDAPKVLSNSVAPAKYTAAMLLKVVFRIATIDISLLLMLYLKAGYPIRTHLFECVGSIARLRAASVGYSAGVHKNILGLPLVLRTCVPSPSVLIS